MPVAVPIACSDQSCKQNRGKRTDEDEDEEEKVNLDPNDFVDLEEVGYGNGGLVFKTVHKPSQRIAARKVILLIVSYNLF